MAVVRAKGQVRPASGPSTEAGEQAAFVIAPLLDEVRDSLEPCAAAKGIAISVVCEPLPASLVGDRARLRRALLNDALTALALGESGRMLLYAAVASGDADTLLVRFEARLASGSSALDRRVPGDRGSMSGCEAGMGRVITQVLARRMGGEAGIDCLANGGFAFWLTARLARTGHEDDRHAARSGAAAPQTLAYGGGGRRRS